MFYLLIALGVFLFFAIVIGFGMALLFKPSNIETPHNLGTTKKVAAADLNKNKALLFGAGLLLSLIISLLTIEAFSREIAQFEEPVQMTFEEEEILDIPITDIPPPPPPKVIIAPVIKEVKEEPKEEIKVELDPEEEEPEEVIYDVPDFEPEEEVVERILNPDEVAKYPEFPGGQEAFAKFIRDNFKMSSRDIAEENKGTVYLKFVVDKNGTISNVNVVRGVSEGIDKESIRVLGKSPKWSPGRDYNGAPVKMYYTIPMRIK